LSTTTSPPPAAPPPPPRPRPAGPGAIGAPGAAGPARPSGSLLGRVERLAWRVPLPSRRLFLALATLAGAALVLSSLGAAAVAARNADTIRDARDHGLGVARASTDFRTHLANADAIAAATLISGGLEDTAKRADYDAEVLAASEALTDAGLAATEADKHAVNALSDGLVRYAGLVETSRANSRQGFPVGAAYLSQARFEANEVLAPQAEQLRREGEQRMARAANSVGGVLGGVAVALLVLGLAVLVAAGLVLAGRTRRVSHPALLLAGVATIAALVIVTGGIAAQGSELRRAATGDVSDYVHANEAANVISELRVTEISAVAARGSGAELYDTFAEQAGELQGSELVTDRSRDEPTLAGFDDAVGAYREAVIGDVETSVRQLDLDQGDNPAAADSTLAGDSAAAFTAVNDQAAAYVDHADQVLADRLAAAADANVNPVVPVLLGVLAAVLAVGGILSRGRKYR
jgi:hypothetical protein